jgi:hypothetical protein
MERGDEARRHDAGVGEKLGVLTLQPATTSPPICWPPEVSCATSRRASAVEIRNRQWLTADLGDALRPGRGARAADLYYASVVGHDRFTVIRWLGRRSDIERDRIQIDRTKEPYGLGSAPVPDDGSRSTATNNTCRHSPAFARQFETSQVWPARPG